MVSTLAKKRCVPCEEGGDPLPPKEAQKLMSELSDEWMLIDEARMLARTFKFKNFKQTMQMVNKIAAIAEAEGHHPDMSITYDTLGVELTTHAMDGLSENDFIVAAKIDELKN